MLPDPPPREPPENPPPPPRALANETVGTPMSAQTMQEAISFLVITGDVLSVAVVDPVTVLHHPNRYGRKKPKIRGPLESRRPGHFQVEFIRCFHAGGKPAQSQAGLIAALTLLDPARAQSLQLLAGAAAGSAEDCCRSKSGATAGRGA